MNNATVTSTVLVLEHDERPLSKIKAICEKSNLMVARAAEGRLDQVLKSHFELGAILLSEHYAGTSAQTLCVAQAIHSARPEVPIILRRDDGAAGDLPSAFAELCCAQFRAEDPATLEAAIGEHIFSLVYPAALVHGISEITEAALGSQFPGMSIEWKSTPYIARDRMIFGEVFTLIPLESNWCRGYMMLQTEEAPLLRHLSIVDDSDPANFRLVNNVLGETTNLIWGAFKNRFIEDSIAHRSIHVQVPLVINHHHRYVSFGTDKAQLCFSYRLLDPRTGERIRLYQRFVFNLNWAPEDFREIKQDIDTALLNGEIELF